MAVFDANQFMETEVKGKTDTTIIPIPEGTYPATISSVAAKSITTKDGNERAVMDVQWIIDDDGVKKHCNNDRPMARQSIFLDLTEENSLDMSKGKNRQLGLLREAVGQNRDGRPWAPGMLPGNQALVEIKHSPNENDPEVPYANVRRVTSVSGK